VFVPWMRARARAYRKSWVLYAGVDPRLARSPPARIGIVVYLMSMTR